LSAGFNTLQTLRNGVFDRLVVARFEMQEGDKLVCAPVAPQQRAFAREIQRAGDIPSGALCQYQNDLLAHAFADSGEEFAGEIRPAPLTAPGIHVEGEEPVPMCFSDVTAAQPLEVHAFSEYGRPFLAQCLALG